MDLSILRSSVNYLFSASITDVVLWFSMYRGRFQCPAIGHKRDIQRRLLTDNDCEFLQVHVSGCVFVHGLHL